MFLETIESKGLAHISYMVGDETAGAAVVIDPRRDVDIYMELARKHGVRITQILETHVHADFVSGSTNLAALTEAPVVGGAKATYGFPVQTVKEGDIFTIGKIKITVYETPGHTPEHVSYLVEGGKGSAEPWGLFTGDTLFAGEVGRPDLLGEQQVKELAHQLYDTLFNKVLKLGDQIEIYPAHGQGSPCGGSIGDRLTSTIGYERMNNTKFKAKSEEEFVKLVLKDLPPAPSYYPRMKKVNAEGAHSLKCLPVVAAMTPDQFDQERSQANTLVLDTREIEGYAGAHIQGSLNIALRDEFPVWSGWMLKPEQRILLVMERHGDLDTIQRHLLRIGIENVSGFLRHGMRGWIEAGKQFRQFKNMSVHEVKKHLESGQNELQILDVRAPGEWNSGKIPTAQHKYVPDIESGLNGLLDKSKPVLTYCGSGYRASIAASQLERMGFGDVRNLPGSMKAWKGAGFEVEEVAN